MRIDYFDYLIIIIMIAFTNTLIIDSIIKSSVEKKWKKMKKKSQEKVDCRTVEANPFECTRVPSNHVRPIEGSRVSS